MTIGGDVRFEANVGQFRADMGQIRSTYARTTGAMSDDALRLAVAQEKLDRTLSRYGAQSLRAKEATVRYRTEMGALARQAERTSTQVAAAGRRTASAEREAGRFGRGAERDAGRFGRGALAGGARSLAGRSFGIASTAFIGGFGAEYAIEKATTAAIEHQAELKQLQVAVKAVGLSYGQYRGEIDKTIERQEKLGFSFGESTKAYALALRATGSVAGANRLLAASNDVARGSGKSLEQTTLLLAKAYNGSVGGLRRVGVFVDKGAKGWDAIRQAQSKYTGAANKYASSTAGQMARLHVAVQETEVTIGTALLPTITRLAGKLSHWLLQSKNQQRIQHDVNAVLHTAGIAVHVLETAFRVAEPPIRAVNTLLGGTKHSLEVLGVALAIGKLGKFTGGLSLLRLAAGEKGAEGGVSKLSTSLGKAGLVTEAGIAAFAISTLVLQVTGLDKKLRSAGGAAYDLAASVGLVHGAGDISVPGQLDHGSEVVARAAQLARRHLSPEQIKAQLAKAYPTLKSHDLDILIASGVRRGTSVNPAVNPAALGPVRSAPVAPAFSPDDRSFARVAAAGGPRQKFLLSGAQKDELALARNPDDRAALESKLGLDQQAASFAERRIRQGRASKALVQSLEDVYGDESSIRDHIQQLDDAQTSKRKQAAETARRKADKEKRDRERAAAKERREQERTILTRGQNLRTDARRGGLGSAAEHGFLAFLSAEIKDPKLSDQIHARLRAELEAEQEKQKRADAKDAAHDKKIAHDNVDRASKLIKDHNQEAVKQAAALTHYGVELHKRTQATILKQRQARLAKLTELPIGLRLEEANALASNASQERMVAIWKREEKALVKQLASLKGMKKTGDQQLDVLGQLADVRGKLRDKADADKKSFSASEFFKDAADEFKTYGGNISSAGLLSGQDAGAAALALMGRNLERIAQHTGSSARSNRSVARNVKKPIDAAGMAAVYGW